MEQGTPIFVMDRYNIPLDLGGLEPLSTTTTDHSDPL